MKWNQCLELILRETHTEKYSEYAVSFKCVMLLNCMWQLKLNSRYVVSFSAYVSTRKDLAQSKGMQNMTACLVFSSHTQYLFGSKSLFFSPTWLYNKQLCHVSAYRDDKEVCSKRMHNPATNIPKTTQSTDLGITRNWHVPTRWHIPRCCCNSVNTGRYEELY